MDVSLQIYIKWMKLLSCLPSCLPFETLLFILIQSSQHRIGTGTDSVVFYMGRYNVFKLWLTIYKQYFFSRFQSRFQLSLIKEAWGMTTQISTKFATYFRVPLCPSLLKLWRKNVKPNIDFHLVHLNCIQLFQGSTERNQNQTANTSFSLFPLWAVTLLYKVCKMSILISRNIKWSKNTCLRYVHGFFTFFHVRSVIYKRRDDETMIAILNSTKKRWNLAILQFLKNKDSNSPHLCSKHFLDIHTYIEFNDNWVYSPPFFSLSVIVICIFLLSSIHITWYFFRIKCSVASFYAKL